MLAGKNSPFQGPFLSPSSGYNITVSKTSYLYTCLGLMSDVNPSQWGLVGRVKYLIALACLWIGAFVYFLIMLVTRYQDQLTANLGPY
jgi:hypothetical protein